MTIFFLILVLYQLKVSVSIINGYRCKCDYCVQLVARLSGVYKEKSLASGTMIQEKWLLTAAYKIKEYIDEHKRNLIAKRASAYSMISRHFIHPKYKAQNAENDIALLQLERSLTENFATFDELDRFGEDPPCRKSIVIGWDNAFCPENDKRFSRYWEYILCANLPLTSSKQCTKILRDHGSNESDRDIMCTAPVQFTGPYYADVGGPIICNRYNRTSQESWQAQVGITSGSSIEEFIDFGPADVVPYVYTKVEKHLEFIQDTIRERRSAESSGSHAIPSFYNYCFWLVLLYNFWFIKIECE